VLLWHAVDAAELGRQAAVAVDEALREARLLVSPISFWEVALLLRKDRIELAFGADEFRRSLLGRGARELPIDGPTAIAAAELPGFHADPADRFLAAAAICADAKLMTADQRILRWDGPLARIDARL
jgi:PIN domain nuclease of toxin-antitoxin system